MAVGRLLLQLLTLLTALLLPWFMPTEEYGRFVSVMALASLGGMLAELGLGWLEMRLLAPAWRSGDRAGALRIASTTFLLRLALDLLVSAALCLWLWQSPELHLLATDILLIGIWMLARFGITLSASMQLPLGHRGQFLAVELGRSVLHLAGALLGYHWGGMQGAFALLAASHLPLFMLAILLLRRHLPLGPASADRALLQQHRHYLTWTALTAMLAGLQFWLPVFLVGAYMDLAQAALLGIAIQALGVLHGLGTGMRQGLMPIIAEQNASQQAERSLAWSSLLLRLIALAGGAGLLVWVIAGQQILALLLPPDYADLYLALALVLPCFVLLSAASASDALLNLRGHASASAFNLGLFTLITVGGTLAVLWSTPADAATSVVGMYLLASAVFAAANRARLGRLDKLWLPLLPSTLLLLPGMLLLAAVWTGVQPPLWLALVVLPAYLGYVLLSGLVSRDEFMRVARALGS